MTVADRMLEALHGIDRAVHPETLYTMQWEYRVLSATPGPPTRIDCEAVDPVTQSNLPKQLVGLLLWPGPSGIVAVPQPGTLVRIGFLNGDAAKPFVAGLDPNGTPLLAMGFVSTVLQLGSASAAPLTPAAWAAALQVALTTFATAMAALTTPPLTPIGTAGTILETALGALPPAATTQVLGT